MLPHDPEPRQPPREDEAVARLSAAHTRAMEARREWVDRAMREAVAGSFRGLRNV